MNTITTLTEEEFDAKFTLVKNKFDDNASFNGCLHETFGTELEFVKSQAPLNKVWTIIECDGADEEDNPIMYYTTGMHHVNRIGYLISNEPYITEMEVKIEL